MTLARSGEGIIVADVGGRVMFMNPAAAELTGRPAATALDRPLAEVLRIVDELNGDALADLTTSALGGVAGTRPGILLQENGAHVHVEASVTPLRSSQALAGVVVSLRDTSGGCLAGQDMRGVGSKGDFFAILAHELRNPLAPIGNALQIMQVVQDDGDGATISAARVIIERQLKNLTRLIDDLLIMSRMTQGNFALSKERTSLSAVIQLALSIARPQLEGKQHKLQVDGIPKDLYLAADLPRLGQAFANLLHNASKYSAAGTAIRITAAAEQDEIVVRVIDRGIGIPTDMLQRVFDLYGQVDRAEDGTHDGLGIGLTLVKRIVELHGGTIAAASAGRGCGSELIVRLPRDHTQTSPEAKRGVAAPPAPTRRLRILVADDNRDAAHTLAMLLRIDGHEVRTAHDGVEALATGDEFAPQLLLLDIGMPLLDGYETARQIRERSWGKQAHLVALTGWGQEADRHRAMDAGFKDYLVKPAEPEALKAVMDGIAAHSPG